MFIDVIMHKDLLQAVHLCGNIANYNTKYRYSIDWLMTFQIQRCDPDHLLPYTWSTREGCLCIHSPVIPLAPQMSNEGSSTSKIEYHVEELKYLEQHSIPTF